MSNVADYMLFHNTSEALEFVLLLALFGGLWRWFRLPTTARSFLTAFLVFIAGSIIREVCVRYGGVGAWDVFLANVSGGARIVQIAGAVLYIRATFREQCGEWPWVAAVALAALYAMLT